MAAYTVTKVRKEQAPSKSHEHIEGVCTDAGTHYTRQQVVDSINAGNTWTTKSGNNSSPIIVVDSCTVVAGCPAKPYIRTTPDDTTSDNLESLPNC